MSLAAARISTDARYVWLMVLPDGVPEPDRRRPGAGGAGASLLSLAVAGLVAGLLTLVATTSTEPRSDLIPRVDRGTTDSRWQKIMALPNGAAYALLSFHDRFLVFTSASQSGDPNLAGLQVWASDDGLNWIGSDPVIEAGSEVHLVSSNALGFVAIGHVSSDKFERAWLSADGDHWLPLLDGLPLSTDDVPVESSNSVLSDLDGTAGDIGSKIGPDGRVIGLTVIEERKVALVARTLDRGRSHDLERFEIWSTTTG